MTDSETRQEHAVISQAELEQLRAELAECRKHSADATREYIDLAKLALRAAELPDGFATHGWTDALEVFRGWRRQLLECQVLLAKPFDSLDGFCHWCQHGEPDHAPDCPWQKAMGEA